MTKAASGSAIHAFLSVRSPELSGKEKGYFILLTGFFVSCFLLFFQPFGVNNYDPSETITPTFLWAMLLMGLNVVVSLAISEFLVYPLVVKNPWRITMITWALASVFWVAGTIFLLYNAMGNWHDWYFTSYLGFVGNIGVVALIPLGALVLYIRTRELKASQASYQADNEDHLLVFHEENEKDQFSIPLKYLVYLEAADNYIVVHHLREGKLTSTLLRSSLKRVQEATLHDALFRCHRSFMINLVHLQQASGNRNKLEVFLNHVKEPLPVSRQYTDQLLRLIGI